MPETKLTFIPWSANTPEITARNSYSSGLEVTETVIKLKTLLYFTSFFSAASFETIRRDFPLNLK